MPATFLSAQGVDVGGNLVDEHTERFLVGCQHIDKLGLRHGAVDAVGAEHEAVAFLVGQLYAVHFHGGPYAHGPCDDVRLCRQACLLLGDDFLLHQLKHH